MDHFGKPSSQYLKGWHGAEEVLGDEFEVKVFQGQDKERGWLAYEGEEVEERQGGKIRGQVWSLHLVSSSSHGGDVTDNNVKNYKEQKLTKQRSAVAWKEMKQQGAKNLERSKVGKGWKRGSWS